ncbi:MAG: hypothetical protein VB091_11520 [Christensenella sp.]|nr:hypothetical protein [Christensenella sp.]
MKLTPPKKVTFWVSIFAFVIGAVLSIGILPVAGLTILGYILVLVSYLLLVFGLVLKGL